MSDYKTDPGYKEGIRFRRDLFRFIWVELFLKESKCKKIIIIFKIKVQGSGVYGLEFGVRGSGFGGWGVGFGVLWYGVLRF